MPAAQCRPRALALLACAAVVIPGANLGARASPPPESSTLSWTQLSEGLSLGEFSLRGREASDPPVLVLKIDPGRYALRLLTASENDGSRLTAREWAARHRLLAAVNAGMYQADGITSVGFMKNGRHLNNPHLNGYQGVVAFDPLEEALPLVQIIDRECQDFPAIKEGYRTLVQNIRMVNCRRENVWKSRDETWSMVVMGLDDRGNPLLISSGSPCRPAEFIDTLLALPLSLRNAVYLEGGPAASFYLNAGGVEIERAGSAGSDSRSGDKGPSPFGVPLPNVLGVQPR